MKIIIDPYRGGKDTGRKINNQLEKEILLELSKYMSNLFKNKGINNILTRINDISLSDKERNNIINNSKEEDDLIIQNRISENNEFNIIYPLRNSDKLPNLISNNLLKEGIVVNNYFQKRLPVNTVEDYYSIIRNTKPNETIIIEYKDNTNLKTIVEVIVDTIKYYLEDSLIYKVKSGDNLYKIAKQNNTTVTKLKEINNLTSNLLSIGQVLKIPSTITKEKDYLSYKVKSGDNLYKIAKQYKTTVTKLKEINNLTSNLLSIGQVLKIPK